MFWNVVQILWFLVGSLGAREDHAFYLSVFDFDLDHGVVQVSVFSDDLINALHSIDSTVVFDVDPCAYTDQIESYVALHLKTTIDGQEIPFYLDHCDLVGETHVFSSPIPIEDRITEIIIESDFLVELFPNQKNIVKVNWDGERKVGRLDVDSKIFRIEN